MRFHKLSQIHFRKPTILSLEPIVMENLASNTGEE